jgi:hypothetical protein
MSEVVAMDSETHTAVQDTTLQDSDFASALAADWEAAWSVYLATGGTVASAFDENINWPDTVPISTTPEEVTAPEVSTKSHENHAGDVIPDGTHKIPPPLTFKVQSKQG